MKFQAHDKKNRRPSSRYCFSILSVETNTSSCRSKKAVKTFRRRLSLIAGAKRPTRCHNTKPTTSTAIRNNPIPTDKAKDLSRTSRLGAIANPNAINSNSVIIMVVLAATTDAVPIVCTHAR